MELLEDRTLPTTNLYIDFGDAMTGVYGMTKDGTHPVTVAEFRETYKSSNLKGDESPNAEHKLQDADLLKFVSFNSVANQEGFSQQNIATLRSQIVSIVQRYYEPFDIHVVIVANNTFNSIKELLTNGPSGSTYVQIAAVVGPSGDHTGFNGGSHGEDLYKNGQPNDSADMAIVFAKTRFKTVEDPDGNETDNLNYVSLAFASTLAHEAGHTFGLRHTDNDTTVLDEMLADLDIMSKRGTTSNKTNFNMFTRYPLHIFPDSEDGYNDGVTIETPYDVLARNFGVAPGVPEYITGTGANTIITIGQYFPDASKALVTVQAFTDVTTDFTFNNAIPIPNGLGETRYSYTVDLNRDWIIDTGINTTRILFDFDSPLANATHKITIRGMGGRHQLLILGSQGLLGIYTPDASNPADLDGNTGLRGTVELRSTVTAGLKTTIRFENVKADSAINIHDVNNFYFNAPTGGAASLIVSGAGAGTQAITGLVGNGHLFVRPTVANAKQLHLNGSPDAANSFRVEDNQLSDVRINGGEFDDTFLILSAAGNGYLTLNGNGGVDTFTVNGYSASGRLQINGGAGTDEATVNSFTSQAAGLQFNGGGDGDTLTLRSYAGYANPEFSGDAGADRLIAIGNYGNRPVYFDGGADSDTIEVYGDGTGPMTTGSLTGLTSAPITWATGPVNVENFIIHNGSTRRVVLNDPLLAGSTFTLDGGTLQGAGTLGALTVTNAGSLRPGTPQFLAFGTIRTGNLQLTNGTLFSEIIGAGAGVSYDNLQITGTVTLGASAKLNINVNSQYLPTIGTVFRIIDNDGSDDVVGTFKDPTTGTAWSEGKVLTFNGGATNLRLSYVGGTGNDVTLTVLDNRPAIGSLTVSPGSIKDDNSDSVTITANNVFSPDGRIDDVAFYLDSNGNGVFDATTDRLLGTDTTFSVTTYAYNGPITGVTPGTYKLFARAHRYTYHDELFSDVNSTTIQVTAAPLPPQVATPAGGETRINASATNSQGPVLLAADYNGNLSAVYAERSGAGFVGVYLQRYSAAGAPIGGNTLLAGASADLNDIAVGPDGAIVVVWSESGNIKVRRYAANGSALGSVITVSTSGLVLYDTGRYSGRIAMDGQGNFIVAWVENTDSQYYTSEDIYYRRYYADGTPRDAAPVRGSMTTTGFQIGVDVAMNSSGNFALTWIDSNSGYPYNGKARVAANGSSTLGAEIPLNTGSVGVADLSIGMSDAGDFAVAFAGLNSPYDVFVRRFTATGAALDAQDVRTASTLDFAARPRIAMNGAGYYVVAYNAKNDPGGDSDQRGVYGQVYAPNGSKLGGQLHLSTSTAGFQSLDGLIITANGGGFVAAWEGNGTVSGQTDSIGAFLQRYTVNLPPVPGGLPTQLVGANSQRVVTVPVTDPNGDAVNVTQINGQAISSGGSVNLPSGAKVTRNANGTLTYEPRGALAVGANDSFTYTVSDGTLTATGALNFAITGPFSVVGVTPALDGSLVAAGTRNFVVQFTEPATGAGTASNYRIQSVGADGLLGTGDDASVTLSLSTDGIISTLDTGGLFAGVYRLTVLDGITGGAGQALDGDSNGTPGGWFVRDFVVGASAHALTSPHSLAFDVQTAGVGAGSLVGGAGKAFDGLNRLQVGGQDYAPPLPAVDVTTAVLQAQVNVNAAASTWQDVPGLNATFTVDGNNAVFITAGLAVNSDATQNLVARILIDGVAPTAGGYTEAYPMNAGVWQEFDFEAVQALTPGSHTVKVQAHWSSGGAVRYDKSPYGIGLLIREFNAFVGGATSVDVASAGIPSTQTVTPTANAWTNVPNLSTTVTVDGTNAVNIHALIGARSSIQQNFYARILVDGAPSANSGYFEQYRVPANSWQSYHVDDTLVLAPGSHTIQVQAMWTSGGTITYDYAPYSVLSVREFRQAPNAGPAVEVYTATMSTVENNSTSAGVWLDVPELTTTFDVADRDTVTVAAQLGVYANAAQDFRARILIDDESPEVGGYVQRLPLEAQTATQIAVQATQTLARGTHTVKVQMYWGSGGHTIVDYSPYSYLKASVFKGARAPFQIQNGGQTLVTGAQTLAGLNVHREITVPNAGSDDFARTVEVFTNPTNADIMTTVHLTGNLGGDAALAVFATSDGDTLVEPTDLWIALDDADGTGRPAVVYLLRNPNGLLPANLQVVGDNLDLTYQVTVAAGATLRLAEYTIVADSRAAAVSAADSLTALSLLIAGPTLEENGGETTVLVTRGSATIDSDLVVTLVSDKPSQATIPATITIPAGQTFAFFTMHARNDALVDGTQTVTITATASNAATGPLSANGSIDVTDDDTPPTSSVAALPATQTATDIALTWSGQTGATGTPIIGYDLYVSDNGGAFTRFVQNIPTTSTNFSGVLGHTYGFFSVAIDQAGNRQTMPTSAQASVTILDIPPTSSVLPLPPTQDSAHISIAWLGETGSSGAPIATYEIWVAKDGGQFTLWQTASAISFFTYEGDYGHSYGFYSIAVDSLGRRQPTPEQAQATVTINNFAASPPWRLNAETRVLTVYGTAAADVLSIAPTKDQKYLQITVAKKIITGTDIVKKPSVSILYSSFDFLNIISGDGADNVTVANVAKFIYVEGGKHDDTFTIVDPRMGVMFEGGDGADTLKVHGRSAMNAPTNIVAVDGSLATVNGIAIDLSGCEKLVAGGQKTDKAAYSFTAANLPTETAVTFVGGGAKSDVLNGGNVANTWNITGAGFGTLNGALSFDQMDILKGGSDRDTLVMNGALVKGKFVPWKITGQFDGGDGLNVLDYTNYTTPVTVDLSKFKTTFKNNVATITPGSATNTGGVLNIGVVLGGSAGDTLTAAAEGSILLGNGGADTLKGNIGRDLLIGGSGADKAIDGGVGHDILIGGTTSYFNEITKDVNLAALQAILTEWRSNDLPFTERVDRLRLGLGAANGNALNGATVKDDVVKDTMTGGIKGDLDRDWFFAALGSDPKDATKDLLKDKDRLANIVDTPG